MKRLRLIAVGVFFSLVVVPAAAANQGGWHTLSGFNGDRANVTGSASIPSTGAVIASVRMESSSGAGLFQVGEIDEGSSNSTDCGPAQVGVFVEYADNDGLLLCNTYFGSFGSNYRFAALGFSGGTWKAYEDGTVIDTEPLDWSSGYCYAAAEYSGSAPFSYSFTWGPSGYIGWQSTTNSGSTYSTISSGSKFNDGGWVIGSLPSPFTISR